MKKYKHLIEDEKEARKERMYMNVALASLFLGLFFILFQSRKNE